MLDLNNQDKLKEFCNHVAASKLIADEIGVNPTYEKIIEVADRLDISVAEVQGYLRLYSFVSNEMML